MALGRVGGHSSNYSIFPSSIYTMITIDSASASTSVMAYG